jgi:hypothetical protein
VLLLRVFVASENVETRLLCVVRVTVVVAASLPLLMVLVLVMLEMRLVVVDVMLAV